MVFVSLRELAMNRLHPVVQCSFSLTYVGHDSPLLPDGGKCQFMCVPFSARCHCKSIACGEGTRVFLVIFRQYQGLKHGRSPHLSPPRVGSPSRDGGGGDSPKRGQRPLGRGNGRAATQVGGAQVTGFQGWLRVAGGGPAPHSSPPPRTRRSRAGEVLPPAGGGGKAGRGRGGAGPATAELRGAAPAVRESPGAGCGPGACAARGECEPGRGQRLASRACLADRRRRGGKGGGARARAGRGGGRGGAELRRARPPE